MEDYEKIDRQLENLENLVENHTRTQRHLEQYSEIGNQANRENARKVQQVREAEIKTLENKIKGEDEIISPEQHLDNLKEKYYSTEAYIQKNKDNMNAEMLRNMQEKQQHREEQIMFLEDPK